MKNILKGKKILITAGPSWVAIDSVRVMTNIFTGTTGYLIAKQAYTMGAKVTLMLGHGGLVYDKDFIKKIKFIPFNYFNELFESLKQELLKSRYDIMIHSAAVSDYEPTQVFRGKIKSCQNILNITCKPTTKIVDKIKFWSPSTFLVKFKLEVSKNPSTLKSIAYKSLKKSNADLIVANSFIPPEQFDTTLIIDSKKHTVPVKNRAELPKILFDTISKKLLCQKY